MKLAELFSVFTSYKMGNAAEKDVTLVAQDHRKVIPGAVFVAITGNQRDGHEFIANAINLGAIAIVAEDAAKIPAEFIGAKVVVEDTRRALELLAKEYFHRPSEKLFCVGITGTNGKTSTTLMVEKILNDFDWPTGVMGTIDHHIGQHIWTSELTTPDPLTLYKRLNEFVVLGAKAATFEVSSHALDQGRADSIAFDVAIFTNLTRDHLDYHGTMEKYFQAKEKLFHDLPLKNPMKPGLAVINVSDQWGPKIRVAPNWQKVTYGEVKCDFQIVIEKTDFTGSHFRLHTNRGVFEGFLPVPGKHNVYNATAAVAVGWFAGRSIESSMESLAGFSGVPGRLQPVKNTKGIHVLVDYAHTDDALRTVLNALDVIRQSNPKMKKRRIITVFGCGGDRDKGKRPLMARAALEGSDLVIVTSDNPRTEDPMAIIGDILKDISSDQRKSKVVVEADRREAIAKALREAHLEDVVLIAGKGHEDYQIVGTEKRSFSDITVASEILNAM